MNTAQIDVISKATNEARAAYTQHSDIDDAFNAARDAVLKALSIKTDNKYIIPLKRHYDMAMIIADNLEHEFGG